MTLDQQTELRREIAVLQEDAEDLRASAIWWRTLYERAIRRSELSDKPDLNKKV